LGRRAIIAAAKKFIKENVWKNLKKSKNLYLVKLAIKLNTQKIIKSSLQTYLYKPSPDEAMALKSRGFVFFGTEIVIFTYP